MKPSDAALMLAIARKEAGRIALIPGDKGRDGLDGKDGKDGVDGKNGLNGRNGKDGKDGRDGKDGLNGRDGQDGKDGKPGDKGDPGRDGISVSDVEIEDGVLIVTLDDGRVFAGDVRGPKGEDGEDGKDGAPGATWAMGGAGRGPAGDDGLSAYQIALANGFEGTEAEWLASLHGADGADAEFPSGATEGQVLTADAQGDPIWADAASGGGSPGGADGELQFNDDGTFAGLSSFTYSGTTYRITEPTEFALHSTYPNGKAEFIKITGATGAPFSTATVGTGLAFHRFTGGVVGGAYVSNSGVFTLENNTGSKITFSAGGNINLSKLSILDTGSNFYPQIRMDATSGKEVGWYVPTFGSEEMRGAVSRVDVLTLKPTGAKIKGGLNLADLPTSATGLASGDIWNDGGTLKVVA